MVPMNILEKNIYRDPVKKKRISAGWIFVIMLGVHLCIFSFFKFAYLFPILLDRREPIAGGMGLGSLN